MRVFWDENVILRDMICKARTLVYYVAGDYFCN